MEDIDSMFSDLLGEMDLLTQSLGPDAEPPETERRPWRADSFSIGFSDPSESLDELEDHDLDALMEEIQSKPNAFEESLVSDRENTLHRANDHTPPATAHGCLEEASLSPALLPSPPGAAQPSEPQTKADKIKLALEKLKEAKLVVKVLMDDGSSKTLMVDQRQTVREVLDRLFEKTYCDRSVDWSLCETNPDLQTERGFEDHEHLVEPLSAWTRDTGNQITFVVRPEKYALFKEPQIFYMWKKGKEQEMNDRAKQLLLQENFEGPSLSVPDLESFLYLKEDGKKTWKRRYFLLRASGIYYVPKGKTKSSADLACFVRFDKVNVYTTTDYKHKYKAPTDSCFILKHPCIQKESRYIRFLCCEDEHTLSLWVSSIRIAKYGSTLYRNYQAALKRPMSTWSLSSSLHQSILPPDQTLLLSIR